MAYTPRTIAFLCELLHPPVMVDQGAIQKVHNQLFQSGSPAYGSFNVTPEGAFLSNPVMQPGAASSAATRRAPSLRPMITAPAGGECGDGPDMPGAMAYPTDLGNPRHRGRGHKLAACGL